MLTVRIQEKNHSESIMVLKLKDGNLKKCLKISRQLDEIISQVQPE